MKDGKIYEDLSLILRRSQIVFIFIVAIFIILVLSFWKIQVFDYQEYWRKSEANRIREVILPPQRGLIKERNGKILAKNVASFKVSLIRKNCENIDEVCQKISPLLNLDPSVLKKRINKFRNFPPFLPVVLKDNLSFKEVSILESRKIEFPELIIEAEPKRYYPHGGFSSHVLGYLQEISINEFQLKKNEEKSIGDLIGKTGIEKEYEVKLFGKHGQVLEITDSLGRHKGEMKRQNPINGQDVFLTLDFSLQKKAEELLEGKEGAIVILDPRSGEILSLASYPNFDPNKFITRFSDEEWNKLVSSSEFPLENRAIRGLYSPGSIFKLVIALAALDAGEITDRTSFFCGGTTIIYGHPFSCWFKAGHGSINLYEAIKHSCNIYFYNVGKKMGIEEISRYARKFGFGKITGIDLPGEKKGLVPDPQWKREVKNLPWYPGETISVSIGQGPILVTPLQVAAFTALVANRGKKITPHLILSKKPAISKNDFRGDFTKNIPIDIKSSFFEKVIKGMWKCVNENGTAKAAKIDGYDICGKTGSTQVISTEKAKALTAEKKIKTHSWFSGFAPMSNPKIVICVLVEYGGMGGETAAPIAKNLFALYREEYD